MNVTNVQLSVVTAQLMAFRENASKRAASAKSTEDWQKVIDNANKRAKQWRKDGQPFDEDKLQQLQVDYAAWKATRKEENNKKKKGGDEEAGVVVKDDDDRKEDSDSSSSAGLDRGKWVDELKGTGQRNDLETKLAEGKKGRVPR